MKRLYAISACFSALAAISVTSGARADEATDLEGLLDEPVVTTASKTPEVGSTAPATSTLITAEDLRRWGIHTIAEAIDFLSLGAMTSNPLNTPEVGARGVLITEDKNDHFLLLVDGHAQNEPLFGSAQFGYGAGIPIELVDHIEVILGPGSVLYGSNAMLGVINVVTKRAKDLPTARVWAEAGFAAQHDPSIGTTKLSMGFESYRVGGAIAKEFTAFGHKGEATFSAEYFDSRGPAFQYGPQNFGNDLVTGQPTRFNHDGTAAFGPGIWGGVATNAQYARVPSGLLHVALGDFELFVRASTFKRAVPYRARYINDVQDFDDPNSYELDRHASIDLVHHARFSEVVALQTRLYGDSFDYQRFLDVSEASGCVYGGVTTCLYKGVGISRWVGLEVQSTIDWTKDGKFVSLVGVDPRVRQVGFKIDALNFDTGAPVAPTIGQFTATEKLVGAYLQQTWTPIPLLAFNAGARLDVDERFAKQISPRVAASVRPWEGGTLKAIYSEAFRSPSYFETDFFGGGQAATRGLRPERVRSVEGSLEEKIGTQRLLFGVFRSWWTDLVELHLLTPQEQAEAIAEGLAPPLTTGLSQFRNVSSIENYGVNAAYDGTMFANTLRYGINVTFAYARRVDSLGSNPLVVAPQAFGNARVAYDLPGALPTVGLAVHWMGQRLADRAYDGGFSPTPVVGAFGEVRLSLTGEVPKVGGLRYAVSGNYAVGATRMPYVVGPYQSATNGPVPMYVPELVPIERFRVMIGLQYDFFTGEGS